MAVSATHKTTNKSDSGASSYSTASITPTANKLLLAAVYSGYAAGTPNQPTLTSSGLTWVAVGTVVVGVNRITLFRALAASPSAGAVTIDFGGQTQDRCYWSISEFDGTDVGGTNGSGAIVQYASNYNDLTANTTLVVTLSAFGSANNATYGFFRAGNIQTAGTGFSLQGSADGTTHCASEFRADNDTSVDETWSSSTVTCVGIACEIKQAVAAVLTLTTEAETDLSETTATSNGTITDIGSGDADERGFVFGTTSESDPGDVAPGSSAYDDFVNETGTFGAASFDLPLTVLVGSTTYYCRAYAHNADGYAYGNEITFDTTAAPPWRFENVAGRVVDSADHKTIYAEELNQILDRLHDLDGLDPTF